MAATFLKITVTLLLSFSIISNGQDVKDRYYPRYHLAPPYGWMNDPNGFSVFNNEYHLFYQHNPNSSFTSTVVHWGHAKSPDLVHWEHLPIALYPDQWYDAGGVFSGSTLVENDTMHVFYTGNINLEGQTPSTANKQAYATSTDGVTFTKYEGNPIIPAEDRQPNIRDPKVWKHNDTYYMVLGNSYNNDTLGRVLLYSSTDKINWKEESIIDQSNGTMGYMWECPDFFELGGKFVLLFSPQGLAAEGDKYQNLYQTGYILGDFDYSTLKFTPTSEFKELDHGHDVYATQTVLDNDGRRIVVAWMDMWDRNYPESSDGFTGLMTLPRELTLSSDGIIIQKAVDGISKAKGRNLHPFKSFKHRHSRMYILRNKAGEINVHADGSKDFKLYIGSGRVQVSISYDADKGQVTLDRGGTDGVRRTEWKPDGQLKWRIFVDASSIELFCGEGEVTFTSRFFPEGPVEVRLAQQSRAEHVSVHEIQRTVPHGGYYNKHWCFLCHIG
ncbi:sucrose-6-phosphate hydrolase-like [Leguminivora glycinivorella]|uniref:sucrose-6-phosphate hydrolase-like n=1 Tax=Leguminivora glycinivorella TaxID=1035111 RepID=UPI00200FE3D6|nr:sucrose-6-phosphate hydrolase-like [Leguminivora glycinivorella]